jgi:hypothetical protein
LPIILAFSRGKTDYNSFWKKEGIDNDGILVLRTANHEMKKALINASSTAKWLTFMQRQSLDLLLQAAYPHKIMTQPAFSLQGLWQIFNGNFIF